MNPLYEDKRLGHVLTAPSAGDRPISFAMAYFDNGNISLDIYDATWAGRSEAELFDAIATRYIQDAYKEPYPLDQHSPDKGQLMFKGVLDAELRYHRTTGLVHPSYRGWTLLTDAIDELLGEVDAFRTRCEIAATPELGGISLIDALWG